MVQEFLNHMLFFGCISRPKFKAEYFLITLISAKSNWFSVHSRCFVVKSLNAKKLLWNCINLSILSHFYCEGGWICHKSKPDISKTLISSIRFSNRILSAVNSKPPLYKWKNTVKITVLRCFTWCKLSIECIQKFFQVFRSFFKVIFVSEWQMAWQ